MAEALIPQRTDHRSVEALFFEYMASSVQTVEIHLAQEIYYNLSQRIAARKVELAREFKGGPNRDLRAVRDVVRQGAYAL